MLGSPSKYRLEVTYAGCGPEFHLCVGSGISSQLTQHFVVSSLLETCMAFPGVLALAAMGPPTT